MKLNDIAWKSYRLNKARNRGPALTLGVKIVEDGYIVTCAFCSPKDYFSKKIAKKIILGRLNQYEEWKFNPEKPFRTLEDGTAFFVAGHYLWLIPYPDRGITIECRAVLKTCELFFKRFLGSNKKAAYRRLAEAVLTKATEQSISKEELSEKTSEVLTRCVHDLGIENASLNKKIEELVKE